MREPPKLYRPHVNEPLLPGLNQALASISEAMAWIQEAVDKIEAERREEATP